MVEVLCVCREWSSKKTFKWEFVVDKNITSSFIKFEEDLQYEDLLKIVSEDFLIQVEDITLSYEISLDLKSTVEDAPPISIGNTRQLRNFIGKNTVFEGVCRLCIKVCCFISTNINKALFWIAFLITDSFSNYEHVVIWRTRLTHLYISHHFKKKSSYRSTDMFLQSLILNL